jgi:hypothetical protein
MSSEQQEFASIEVAARAINLVPDGQIVGRCCSVQKHRREQNRGRNELER